MTFWKLTIGSALIAIAVMLTGDDGIVTASLVGVGVGATQAVLYGVIFGAVKLWSAIVRQVNHG